MVFLYYSDFISFILLFSLVFSISLFILILCFSMMKSIQNSLTKAKEGIDTIRTQKALHVKEVTGCNHLMIGRGAVVGMGAVVTKSVPAGEVVVGNPAKPLQKQVLK